MADAVDVATRRFKELYEEALSGSDGVKKYILQVCDVLRQNKLKKDIKKNKKQINKIFQDLAFKITNPDFWNDNKNMTICGSHGGYVGKTGDGLKIIKRDSGRAERIYFVRYYNPENQKTYLRLLGYQLSSERDLGWQSEVRSIRDRYRGEVFTEVDEFVTDSSGGVLDHLKEESHILTTHGGYISIDGEVDLTENYIESLEHEANIIITDDQFRQIAKRTPLLIDGHAGTGKSIIIALRIAIHYATYDSKPLGQKEDIIPSLLVVAYNQRVLKMIERYANFWIKKMIPRHNQKYLNRIEYIPTLKLYHMLLNEHDNHNIIDPTRIESTKTFINFYRFQTEFFNDLDEVDFISAEQAWHFIRGILKGRELGWFGQEDIKINDFGSVSGDPLAKVSRKATDKMPMELIQSLISVHRKYEKWRVDNNYLDDIDLVRRSLQAIEKDLSLEEDFISKFHTVLIDEGQDLTIVEFKLLTYLLREYSEKVNIVVGGDPLQTINPTGFSWENLETFITQKVIEDSGKKKFDISPSRMLVSHRMPKPLVDFSNVIISGRAKISKESIKLMKALDELSSEGIITKVAYDVDDAGQREQMNEFIASALGSDIGTIIWARDSRELETLKKKDDTITALSMRNNDDNLINEDIHSIESVKGLEFETVILYRFGDLSENFENLINTSLSKEFDFNDEESYEQLYFLNRLFIASTRSKKNLIIIDSEDSMDACWNDSLWEGKAHNTLPLADFVEIYKTKPNLTKATNYFQRGSEKGDVDLLHKALASAKQCEESVDRTELLINIEITTLEIEIRLPTTLDQNKAVKRDRLIVLYEETGDLQKAIYERIILEKWNIIHEVYKSKRKKYPLIWEMAAFKTTGDPKHRDHLIDIYSKHIKHVENRDAREVIISTFRKICRSEMKHMDNDRLKKVHEKFDWIDWITTLTPNWYAKGKLTENQQLGKVFMQQMKLKFGENTKDWKNHVHIKILEIQLENPDGSDKEKAEKVALLAEKGDTKAVKKQISVIFNDKKKSSITSKKWVTIKGYVDTVSSDLETSMEERDKLVSRINDICTIINLRTGEFAPIYEAEWIEALKAIKRIKKNPDINSNGMQEISFVSSDVYAGFLTILTIDEQKIQQLVKFLIDILAKSSAKRSGFIAWNWETSKKFIEFFESNESLNVDVANLYEYIIDTIAHNRNLRIISSEMVRYILTRTDESRNKHMRFNRRLVQNLQILFERHGWYDWYWKHPGTILPWLLNAFQDDGTIKYKEKLQFHLLVRNWKDGKKVDVDDLVTLCEIRGFADRELVLEIKKAAGYDDEQLIGDMIQTMDIEKLIKQERSNITSVLIEKEYDCKTVLWNNNYWFEENKERFKTDGNEIKDPLKQMIYYSIYSDSFANAVINVYPQEDSKSGNEISKELLGNFWRHAANGLNKQIDIEFNKSEFWELMRRDRCNLSASMKIPASRATKDNWDINALAVIDVLLMMSKLKADKKRIKYLNSIGLLKKSTYTKEELVEALFNTDLFVLIFKDEPDLIKDAKGII